MRATRLSVLRLTLFVIVFQDVNRGFVPFRGMDFRYVSFALISILLVLRFLEGFLSLSKKKYVGTMIAVVCTMGYFILTYLLYPLAPMSFFTRRLFQLVYVVVVLLLFFSYSDMIVESIGQIINYLAFSLIFFLMGQVWQFVGLPMALITRYSYTVSDAPVVTWIPGGLRRLSSFAFDPNIAGIYLGVGYSLFRGIAAIAGSRRATWLSRICLLGLLMTFSRGAILGLTIVILSRMVVRLKKPDRMLVFEFFSFAVLTICYIVLSQGIERFLDVSNSVRLSFWTNALNLLMKNILLGVGFSNIGEKFIQIGMWWAVVHNSYLHVAVETGLIGFSAYFAFLAGSFRAANRLENPIASKMITEALMINCVIIFFISEQFDPTVFILGSIAIILGGVDGGDALRIELGWRRRR